MKQSEILDLLRNGDKIIVSRGLYPTAQIGVKRFRFDTFMAFLRKGLIELDTTPRKYTSLLEYYKITEVTNENTIKR